MLSAILPVLKKLKEKGVSRHRQRRCGRRGLQTVRDEWRWPRSREGFLFPAPRSKGKPRTKDAVCHMIVKARKSFDVPGVDAQRVRSHSGRHTFINDLKRSEI